MSEFRTIQTADIEVSQRLRDLDEAQVDAIKDSVLAIGLLNPITVYPRDLIRGGLSVPGFGLIAGAHRLEAYRRIGYEEIPASVVDLSDLEAQLAECDENLCRAELSPTDRARFVKRRKDAYEAFYPQSRHGSPGVSRQVGDIRERNENQRFTADTAAKTGQSERAVQRDAERGEKVIPEVMDLVRGTKLDTGAYLDKIKRLPPNEQVQAAKRDLQFSLRRENVPASGHSGGGVAARFAPAAADTSDAFDRFIILVDRMEELPVASVIKSSGRQRSVLGQRTSSLIDRLTNLLERLDQ